MSIIESRLRKNLNNLEQEESIIIEQITHGRIEKVDNNGNIVQLIAFNPGPYPSGSRIECVVIRLARYEESGPITLEIYEKFISEKLLNDTSPDKLNTFVSNISPFDKEISIQGIGGQYVPSEESLVIVLTLNKTWESILEKTDNRKRLLVKVRSVLDNEFTVCKPVDTPILTKA